MVVRNADSEQSLIFLKGSEVTRILRAWRRRETREQYGSVVRGGVWAGCGQIIRRFLGTFEHVHLNIIISIRTLSLNARACLGLQTTIVLLSIFFSFKYISFQIGLASIHRFLNKSLSCK